MSKRPKPFSIGEVRCNAMDRSQGDLWYWRARLKGRTVWTGWATRKDAQVALAALVSRGLPASRVDAHAGVKTVRDLLASWVDHQERRHQAGQIAPRSIDNYRRAAGYWLEDLGDLVVDALTRAHIEDTLTAWQAAGVAPRTCKAAIDALAAAVRWGAERGHCRKLELSRLESLRIRDDEYVNCSTTPTPAEVGRVLEVLPEGQVRDAITLLAWTGARVGEVAMLRVDDVDLEARVLVLSGRGEGRRGKTGRRRFPLAGELLELLADLVQGRAAGEPLLDQLPRDVAWCTNCHLEAACEATGVDRFTNHGLRRMAATRWLDAGVDAKTVSKLTGHSVITLLRNYVRPSDESLRRAVSRGALPSLTGAGGTVLEYNPAQKSGTGGVDGDE